MPRSAPYQLSVIAPCYNEEANLPALCERTLATFEKHGIRGQIVLVDDGSRDKTLKIAKSLAARHPNILVVHHDENKGIEAGWNSGLRAATGVYACLIDADLQYLPEEIWRLYKEIGTGRYDIVQGVRSSIGRLRDSRYLFSVVLNTMLNVLFGMRARDNKSGFVIALKETLLDILRHRYQYAYFQTFITVSAKAKNYSIGEVETLFQSRYAGKSFIQVPYRVILLTFVDLAKAFMEFRVRRKRFSIIGKFLREHPVEVPMKKKVVYRGWRKLLMETYFLTMPLHKWKITPSARRFYYYLQQTQWLSPAAMKALQEARLKRLIRHVYYHVPYYRDMFDKLGIDAGSIRKIEDLQKLPLLAKPDIRSNLYFSLFAENHRKKQMLKISTSGSTGEPFVTYADRPQLEMRFATTLRALEWTGWRFGDRQMRLWHQTIGMDRMKIFKEHLDALLMRRTFVPAFELKEKNFKKLVRQIRRVKPKLLDGYAECFNFLSHFARTKGIEPLHVPAIMSSAQTLPPHVRKTIEQAFGAKLYDKYGSREFSGIAYECGHGEGYHVMGESYIVEILKNGKPAKPGELGEVVITDLNNFSVPLIRYRLGDLAVAIDPSKPCPCGRGLPRIGRIEGRVQSVIHCKDGTLIPGTFFAHFFKEYDYAIRQYLVVQENETDITLKIVKEALYTRETEREIRAGLKRFLGKEMKLRFALVKSIPLGKTGKHTAVISHVPTDFQGRTKRKKA